MSERYGYGTYEDNDNRRELLARPDGFTADGKVAGDYLAAGTDPNTPRLTGAEVARRVARIPLPPVTDRNEDGSPVVLEEDAIVACLRHHLRLSDLRDVGAMTDRDWDYACLECGVPVEALTEAIISRVRVFMLRDGLEDRRR